MSSQQIVKRLTDAQRNELTEHFIYERLSRVAKDSATKKLLREIADDELRHYELWKSYTAATPRPKRLKLWFYYLVSRLFGFTFGLKLMERGESQAQLSYGEMTEMVPEMALVVHDEESHERELLGILDEERLHYVGAIVRGLNEAVVEIVGVLAGFTLVWQESRLVIATGLVVGVSMALSLGGTEYLAARAEEGRESPLKAALYSGAANLLVVVLLLVPYFVLDNPFISLGIAICIAALVIAFFSFYMSVARESSFKGRFGEMILVGLGVAGLTFAVGHIANAYFGVGH